MSAGVTTRLGCAVATTDRVIAEDAIRVLDHGFVLAVLAAISSRRGRGRESAVVGKPT
jgi:hypothetical protein